MNGPRSRFDPHRPDANGDPQDDPDGRSVLYIGVALATSLCEVFGEIGEALVCPRWRVALLEPTIPLVLFDLCAPGSAMAVRALPALASGNEPRPLTQQWARAIYEDQPASQKVTGIRYRSAYNDDFSLAVWDSAVTVRSVTASGGRIQDFSLDEGTMLSRAKVACSPRRITVETISSIDCLRCLADP
jgi:RES domain